MDQIINYISPSGLIAIVILGCCALYLLSGKLNEDKEFESGVSKFGLLIVTLIIVALCVRFGLL